MAGVELATAYVSIVPTTRGMGKDITKQFGQVESAAAKTGSNAGAKLKSGLMGAAKVAGAAVAGLVGAALVKGWGRLTAIENAQAKLKGLGHDAGAVQSIMDNALASVKGTAFGLDEAATTAAGAVAAGIKPGAELEGVLKTVANTAAASGTSMEDMGGIFNKVAAVGRAYTGDISQLANRGIPIWQELAKTMGVSTDEVRKMASKGEIDFATFSKAAKGAAGTVADEMGKTTTGSLANFWAAIGRFGAELLSGVFPQIAPMFTGLTEKVDALAASVAPAAAAITEGLVGGIKSAFTWMQTWWPLIATVAAGIAGYALVIGTIRVATGLWAAAQWALNAAMTANPIGFIIAAIAALVVGLVLAYNKVGWFRTAVDATFNGIKFVVGVVVSWFQNTFMPVINTVLTAVGGFFRWLYNSVIKPVFNGIKLVITTWWAGVKLIFSAVTGFLAKVFGPAFKFFGAAVKLVFQLIRAAIQIWWAAVKIVFTAVWNYLKRTLGPVFQWLYNNVIKPVWNGIQKAIQFAWKSILQPIFKAIVAFVKNQIQPRFSALMGTVRSVWSAIQTKIKAVWDFVKAKAFDPLAKVIKDTLPGAFRKGRDAIGKAWDGLKSLAKKPVEFVLKTIIQKGIIDNFNKIAKVFGADEIDPIWPIKGWATGGYTGSGSKYTPAGVVHADEYVLRKESQNKISRQYGRGFLDHMNRTGDVPGYAKGGKVKGGTLIDAANWWVAKGAKGSRHPAFGGAVRSGHSRGSMHYQDKAVDLNFAAGTSAYEQGKFDKYLPEFKKLFKGIRVIWKAKDHFNHMHIDTSNGADIGNFAAANGGGDGGGIASYLNPFQGLIEKVSGGVGKSGFGKMIGEGAKKAIQWPIDWLSDKAGMVGDFVEGAASKVVDFAKDAATKTQVRTVATGYGWGFGKQWDAINWLVNKESGWNPNAANPSSSARGLFQKMTSVHGPVEKTAGGQANWGLNYIKGRYGSPVGAMNFHKRKGYYSDGGLVTPTLFDKGGVLNPGTHLVANKTGKPEYILPARVTDALMDQADVSKSNGKIELNVTFNGRVDDPNDVVNKLQFEMNRFFAGGKYA